MISIICQFTERILLYAVLHLRGSPVLTREDRTACRPVKPSWIALAGLTGAVGSATVEVVSMIERVGVTMLRLDDRKKERGRLSCGSVYIIC